MRDTPPRQITAVIAQIRQDRLLPDEADCRNMSNISIE